MTNFETISIPKDMVKFIDLIRSNEKVKMRYYFTSRSQFVRYSITHFIKYLEDDLNIKFEIPDLED